MTDPAPAPGTALLLTMDEVAHRIKWSKSATYALAREPGFPVLFLGKGNRGMRVPADALERWWNERLRARMNQAQVPEPRRPEGLGAQ